jgi:hypothetical protein
MHVTHVITAIGKQNRQAKNMLGKNGPIVALQAVAYDDFTQWLETPPPVGTCF